jgi:hypothetical protein
MLGKLGIDTSNPVTKRFDFGTEGLKKKEKLVDGNGTRGTLSSDISRIRPGQKPIDGPISFEPNVAEMALLLPWIFGGTPTGSGTVTYPLADTIATRFVTIDRILKVFTYTSVGVDSATFRAAQGSTLSLDLNLVATTDTVGNAGTFPDIDIDTASGPWIFEELVLSVNSTTVKAKSFELTVANRIDRQRFYNSLTLTSVIAHDREINFRTSLPYGDHSALYDAGSGGVEVEAVFTNGTNILTFAMGKVAYPAESPNIPGRMEIMLPIAGQAFADGDTKELITTIQTS